MLRNINTFQEQSDLSLFNNHPTYCKTILKYSNESPFYFKAETRNIFIKFKYNNVPIILSTSSLFISTHIFSKQKIINKHLKIRIIQLVILQTYKVILDIFHGFQENDYYI